MTWQDLLQLPETVLWAWRKVRRSYESADSLYDQAELAAFELNLEAELASIRADFDAGRWSTKPLRLVPQPKSPDKQGNPRLRQYFELAVRDQVGWMAIATVLGPELDRKMPAWSYGNRLYRAAWYEDNPVEGRASQLNIGPYRHAAGHLYRKFKHSWPLYRRHISLTARRMVDDHIDPEELDHGERRALDQDEGLAYLDRQHWQGATPEGDTLYAASFDLMKFYPTIKVAAIQRGFEAHVEGLREEPVVLGLLSQMLRFEVDDTGLADDMKAAIQPPVPVGVFDGIPTGLFVGGFLANVAMLTLDLRIDEILIFKRDVAHFRFVDDHEVLAYDFSSLLDWIREYARLLEEADIGVRIEPDKYVPFDIKWLIDPEALEDEEQADRPSERDSAIMAKTAKAAAVNGRKPTQLMTRTLAQVSLLAATDFDLLTDAGRSQRLEQLEWLLLANIPDQEIRGDTRMAFAAARIAMLTPSLFRPNEELLMAHRALQTRTGGKRRNSSSDETTDEAETGAVEQLLERIGTLQEQETRDWQALLKRHFGLLFEAFAAHPDKVRLFIRLIDYCRSTGFDGLGRLSEWMKRNRDNETKLLQCYLGAIAMQALSRHVLTASTALTQTNLLHRERASAFSFLESLLRTDLDSFVPLALDAAPCQRFQEDARRALCAALLLGALEVEGGNSDLAVAMRSLATKVLPTEASLSGLSAQTQVPIGIWYHWFLATTRSYRDAPPLFWPTVEAAHRIANSWDLISLRRYPSLLPEAAWEKLRDEPDLLAADDAGWLSEAARAAPDSFARLPDDFPAVSEVRANIVASVRGAPLVKWVAFTSALSPNDPRRSEWTALETIRQILAKFAELDGPDFDELDRLHPESVLVDWAWTKLPEDGLVKDKWTWEGWRRHASQHPVMLATPGLQDYRYRQVLDENDRRWERRLRPIGQLLWGILRGSFNLPAAWNIRGQERSLAAIVAGDLERLPISSFTLTILQACLLPRSIETAFLLDFPSLFGNRHRQAADDTQFDKPIKTLEQLSGMLKHAQEMLVHCQMTVLEHEPRQLIPVQLQHVGRLDDGPAAEEEELV